MKYAQSHAMENGTRVFALTEAALQSDRLVSFMSLSQPQKVFECRSLAPLEDRTAYELLICMLDENPTNMWMFNDESYKSAYFGRTILQIC